MTENEQSLIVREDDTTEEPLSETLGGYQALVLLVAVVIVIFIVFALPTAGNPVSPTPDDTTAAQVETTDLIDTLAGLSVEDIE